jgi:hypothetical protein
MPVNKLDTLVDRINVTLGRAAQYADKAEQFYVSAGLELAECKTLVMALPQRSRPTWEDFAREKFDLGQSRADELIRIATGVTTLTEVRDRDHGHKEVSSVPRGAELEPTDKEGLARQRLLTSLMSYVKRMSNAELKEFVATARDHFKTKREHQKLGKGVRK